jgi:hypothetical protein
MRYPRVLLTVVAPLILPWNDDSRFMLSPVMVMVGVMVISYLFKLSQES